MVQVELIFIKCELMINIIHDIWQSTNGISNVVVDAPDTSSHTYQFAIYREGGSDGKIRYSPNSASTGSQIIMLEIQP